MPRPKTMALSQLVIRSKDCRAGWQFDEEICEAKRILDLVKDQIAKLNQTIKPSPTLETLREIKDQLGDLFNALEDEGVTHIATGFFFWSGKVFPAFPGHREVLRSRREFRQSASLSFNSEAGWWQINLNRGV